MIEDDDLFNFESERQKEPPLLSVSALLLHLREAIDANFSLVRVIGEVHSFKPAPSGHWYIDLKDERKEALLQLCFFRNARRSNAFVPKPGDLVEVRGYLNIYEPRGQLSLRVTSLEPAGEGALYARFMALKARLEADGLFDPSRKKPIPPYPKRVGIVTSSQGAALRDVVKTIALRAPNIALTLYPTSVQGAEAEAEVIRALKEADKRAEVDCLLLVRGGGSLADLWTFNGEELARTIAQMRLPIISGIGHETDTTIADFVADCRAATPTAAAMVVSEGWQKGGEFYRSLVRRLAAAKDAKLREARANLRALADPRRAMRRILDDLAQRQDDAVAGLHTAAKHIYEKKKTAFSLLELRLTRVKPEMAEKKQRVAELRLRLNRAQQRFLEQKEQELSSLFVRLIQARPRLEEKKRRVSELARRLKVAPLKWLEQKSLRAQNLCVRLERAKPDCKVKALFLKARAERLRHVYASVLAARRQSLEIATLRLKKALPNTPERRNRIAVAENSLTSLFRYALERKRARLDALTVRLRALDTQRVLERGFCLVRDEKGEICSTVEGLNVGSRLEVSFSDGKVASRIEEIAKGK